MITFNPTRMGLWLLAGFLIGLLCISLGFAAPAHSKRRLAKHSRKTTHRSVHKVAPKKTVVAFHPKKVPHPMLALKNYAHPEGQYKFSYPEGWEINAKQSAMIVRSTHHEGGIGVFGILRRSDQETNDMAVAKEFSAADRPSNLVQSSARLAGLPATKVMGSSKEDPNLAVVEYYIQNAEGHQYYILLRAPRGDWKRYQVAFNTMIGSLSFY